MHAMRRFITLSAFLLLGACASTTVSIEPSPQSAVCNSSATALVLWSAQWRPDQKDIEERERAASDGMNEFFSTLPCFAHTSLHKAHAADIRSKIASGTAPYTKVITISVRELGPVVKLLSSLALVDGGTEVVLEIAEHNPATALPTRQFTIHWANGGAGVIKGVSSLPADMKAALIAALQPAS
jgi:hypothetical protein